MQYINDNLLEYCAYQTMPCAPDPIGFKFWYRFKIVNFVSPTSTVKKMEEDTLDVILGLI